MSHVLEALSSVRRWQSNWAVGVPSLKRVCGTPVCSLLRLGHFALWFPIMPSHLSFLRLPIHSPIMYYYNVTGMLGLPKPGICSLSSLQSTRIQIFWYSRWQWRHTSPVLDYAYANILKSNIHSKFKLLLAPGFYMGKLGSKYNFCVAETLPQESAIALCLSGIDWKQFAKVITAKSYSSFPS